MCFALTAPIFKWQIFSTRTKLSFESTPMANQTYPQDGLMCGVNFAQVTTARELVDLKFFLIFQKSGKILNPLILWLW